MAKTYTKCADEVHRKITALINQHHKELRHVAARVEALNVTHQATGEGVKVDATGVHPLKPKRAKKSAA